MSSLKAQQLLHELARLSDKQRGSFSREEIISKINQIKYLSGQRSIPKVQIKREIAQLEEQMHKVFDLEAQLKKLKKNDAEKTALLKKQIAALRAKIAQSEDRDLSKKVARLSYLLGDLLAKRGTSEDIKTNERLLKEMEVRLYLPAKKKVIEVAGVDKSSSLKEKLAVLKQKVEGYKSAGLDPIKISMIEIQIAELERKIYPASLPENTDISTPPVLDRSNIRHEMFFDTPVKVSEQKTGVLDESELPLPPPPKMKK